jgi:DNA repair protein RecO (recombination protein O)
MIIETEAILLKKTELRETSFILDFYTRESGRIKGVIKGVRSPQPQFGSLFEIFSLDRITFYERKNSDIFIISHCDLIDFFPELRKDLERLGYASYYTELIGATCGIGEKNEEIFELVLGTLRALSGDGSPKRITRVFEIKLLKAQGLMPRLKQCINCGKKDPTNDVRFSIKGGGILCDSCRGTDPHSIAVMAGTMNFIESVSHAPLDRVSRLKVSEDVGRELERFMKIFLNFHIQKHFKSVEFMEQIGVL